MLDVLKITFPTSIVFITTSFCFTVTVYWVVLKKRAWDLDKTSESRKNKNLATIDIFGVSFNTLLDK